MRALLKIIDKEIMTLIKKQPLRLILWEKPDAKIAF